MGDLRPALDPAMAAFGVPAVITRPAPNDTPVTTTGIWMSTLPGANFSSGTDNERRPFGTDFQKFDPRRVISVPRTAALPNVPRGSTVLAAEMAGAAATVWKVDGYEHAEADHFRLFVVTASADGS